MRLLFLGLAFAAMTAAMPSLGLAGDLETAQQIAENLRTSGKLKGFSIGVTYRDGTATLNGKVTSPQQKAMAMAIVQQSSGVGQVIDRLTITAPAAPAAIAIVPATPAIPATPVATTTKPRGLLSALPKAFAPSQIGQGQAIRQTAAQRPQLPVRPVAMQGRPGMLPAPGQPIPTYALGGGGQITPARYDRPHLPRHAWPSYASYPNYAAVTYPKQYSATAWPFIGPFYPYPQVPLGWRRVTLEWDDGWWMLDFKARRH